MAKKKLLVDKEAFCNWYFDHDICKEFFNKHSILESLENDGEFKITLQEILDGVGYLPVGVIVEGQEPIVDENDEVCMDEYDVFMFYKTKK